LRVPRKNYSSQLWIARPFQDAADFPPTHLAASMRIYDAGDWRAAAGLWAAFVGETAAACSLRESISFRHCSVLRVECSIARDPLHPSAATTNAPLAGDLDDIPLGTPKEASALCQTRFYEIDEQPPETNDPHHRHPKNELTHFCFLSAFCVQTGNSIKRGFRYRKAKPSTFEGEVESDGPHPDCFDVVTLALHNLNLARSPPQCTRYYSAPAKDRGRPWTNSKLRSFH
jgi:hypothetical protein